MCTLNTSSDSVIEVFEEDKADPAAATSNDLGLLKSQLELTDGLLRAKRAELEKHEIKHNEDIKLFQKRLQTKDCEITLLKKMGEDLKEQVKKKEDECKDQERHILSLHSELEKERREKKEAIGKLAAVYQISRPENSDRPEKEEEYVEKFSQDSAARLKRESEAAEEEEDEEEREKKKSRFM